MDETVAALRSAGCVYAEEEARLLHADPRPLAELVARRVAGEPLEQVLGWAEFGGLRIAVEPGVFVPRRRTEFLVELVVGLRPSVLVDLCCGTAAIAAAVASRLEAVEVHAADLDPVAVRCARRNVAGPVHLGDLYEALPDDLRGRVDVLAVNAPYVPSDEVELMPREARLFEAPVALDGGADGVEVQRRVIAGAREWLAPGGHLLIETSPRQAPPGLQACTENGLRGRIERDEDREATVLVASARE